MKWHYRTSDLEGAALDWAVAKALGVAVQYDRMNKWYETSNPAYAEPCDGPIVFSPSADWEQGGPIIEREGITLRNYIMGDQWDAELEPNLESGPTPLVAAMRCYVASKLGDEITIPEELR